MVIDLEARQGNKGQDMQCKECKDIAPPLTKEFVYWECSCFKNQPERLNPEDVPFNLKDPVYDWGRLWNLCDSPTPDNK